jgi:release factor glutamine methyltransferase
MADTLVSLWTRVRNALEQAGVDLPVHEARLIVEAGAGVSRLDIITDPRRAVKPAQVNAVEAITARRCAREPLAYILGRKAFWTLDLLVTSDVLIPRPETEFVVDTALKVIAPNAPARVLDLGVGSGAILLSILSARALTTGVGADRSVAALEVARQNAAHLGLAERVRLVESDWWSNVDGAFDVVVANPPYVAEAEIAALAPEVANHEPRLALAGGIDGLEAYRIILARLPQYLRPGGVFALEVGRGQSETVAAIARSVGLAVAAPIMDLAGIPRVVTGNLPLAEKALGTAKPGDYI